MILEILISVGVGVGTYLLWEAWCDRRAFREMCATYEKKFQEAAREAEVLNERLAQHINEIEKYLQRFKCGRETTWPQ